MMVFTFSQSRRLAVKTILALGVFGAVAPVYAEDGVSDKEIKIGMANALSGPAAGLGTQLKAGAEAYFAKVNAGGGINGRKITLVSLDDGYEPDKAAAATKKLIDEDKVFALLEALKKAGSSLTRSGLVGVLEGMNTDLGGLNVGFSAAKHQGASQIFMT